MIKRISKLAVVLAAAILGITLMSGLATINFNHKHKLPKVLSSSEAFSCSGVFFRSCSVHLTTTVKDPNHYQTLLVFIHKLSSLDRVTVYLNGYGGRVDSTLQLINAIKHSPAHFTMIVEAPVHSAHAYLAVSGDKLIMRPMTYLMLHRSSGYGEADKHCSSKTGTDRTLSVRTKCYQYYEASMVIDVQFVRDTLKDVISPVDIHRILNGEDVYLYPAKAGDISL